MALTLKSVATLIHRGDPGRHLDDRGLYLIAKASSWQLRYQLNGKAHWMGLGSARDFTLLEARERARVERQRLADKLDPITLRRAERSKQAVAKVLTFQEAADEYVADNCGSWRSADHERQWSSSLQRYIFPVIGQINVTDIGRAEILKVLEQTVAGGKLWLTRPVTAERCRSRIELVLNRAMARADLEHDNPASRDKLKHVLPAQVKMVKRHPALPYSQLPQFIDDLHRHEGIAAKASEFLILTAARTSEVTGAVWPEIEQRLWVIPAERMKGKREHRVPLSDAAIALLQSLPIEQGNPFVFLGSRQQGISNAAMSELLKRMAYKDASGKLITIHGFRSTFADWCTEQTAFDEQAREFSLAHVTGDASSRAYARGDVLEKRRKLMQAWAGYCQSVPGDVIPIRRAQIQ